MRGRKLEFDGNPDKALASYLLVVRLGNHVSCGPFLIDDLVAISCNVTGLKAIEGCILRNELDERTLADVQERLHAFSTRRPRFSSAMKNERAYTEHEIEYTVRDPGWFMGGEEAWQGELEKYSMTPDEWRDMMRGDVAVYWEVAEDFFRMPLPELLAAEADDKLKELVNAGKGERPLNMMSLLGSTLARAGVEFGKGDLYWTMVDVELALARCKLRHGRYPDKVEEVKDLMLSDGLDPFSGQPLHYRLEDDGSFTVWSVGLNLTDDGGDVPDTHNPWQGDDYVWNSRLIGADPGK